MSFGARLSNVCVSEPLVQLESARLLYVIRQPFARTLFFRKKTGHILSETLLKFSDFPRNHDAIYFSGKCIQNLL